MQTDSLISRRANDAIFTEDNLWNEDEENNEEMKKHSTPKPSAYEHRTLMKAEGYKRSIGTGLGFGNVAV